MATPESPSDTRSKGEATAPDPEAPCAPAWELVEAGRYRPRRIRGSFPGRELG